MPSGKPWAVFVPTILRWRRTSNGPSVQAPTVLISLTLEFPSRGNYSDQIESQSRPVTFTERVDRNPVRCPGNPDDRPLGVGCRVQNVYTNFGQRLRGFKRQLAAPTPVAAVDSQAAVTNQLRIPSLTPSHFRSPGSAPRVSPRITSTSSADARMPF